MMKQLILCALALGIAVPASAAELRPNPQIDYPGFVKLAGEVQPERAKRLLGLADFKAMAKSGKAVILDARSRSAFRRGHIKGAINLPFTDFTADALADALPDQGKPILIYCNNNFSNHKAPVALKSAPVSLNIQTFINLAAYGYHNVYELREIVDFNDPKVGWVKG